MNSTLDVLSALERFSMNRSVEVQPLNPSSLIWFRIRRAYEDEKRRKKQRDIENKPQVFTLVRKISEQRKQRYSVQYQKNLISPQIQDNPMHTDDVNSLIKIIKVMYKTADVRLLQECILRKISELKAAEDVLSTLTKFLYCPIYLKDGMQSYKSIQQRMITIVLNTNKMEYCNPAKVVQFVRSLPFISENSLQLLSFLLEEISDPQATTMLYDIFMRLFPKQPSEEMIRLLIRVSNHKAVEQVYNLTKQGLIYLNVLEQQARNKLKKIPKEFNERGKAMLKFVFFVTAHGGSIWTDIIQWEKTATTEYKNYLKEQAQNIVNDKKINIDYLLAILMKLTDINYQSEIADIFFNHVINLNSRQNKALLNTIIVRRFLSSKLLYKLNLLKEKGQPFVGSSLELVFNKDMSYSDVLLELLQNDANSKMFYSYFLQSDTNDKILLDYLDLMLEKKKAKFKTFFVKSLNNTEELLGVGSKKLLKYFMEKMPLELCYASIKEISSKSPALYYMLFIIHWLRVFKRQGKTNYSFLRSCIIRNLNLILIRSDLELSTQFLHDFIKMRKEQLSPDEAIRVMADIPRARKQAIESSH